jgi:preprotein translocase subunit SecB
LFHVVDAWPKAKVKALVEANGAALLYGAIRELVINLTSRGPWPAVVLNAVTFIRPEQKAQEQVADKAVANKS